MRGSSNTEKRGQCWDRGYRPALLREPSKRHGARTVGGAFESTDSGSHCSQELLPTVETACPHPGARQEGGRAVLSGLRLQASQWVPGGIDSSHDRNPVIAISPMASSKTASSGSSPSPVIHPRLTTLTSPGRRLRSSAVGE